MLTTAVIALREFMEAFLIVGVFLGISKRLNLKKEFEIGLAAAIGVSISLFLAVATYAFGDRARGIITEDNAEFLEGYLMVFSGAFLAYVIFSLHGVIRKGRGLAILKAHQKLQANVFDVSLFFTIMFMVLREGFEIALFTASVSLFSAFIENIAGLLVGFVAAGVIGISTFFAYIKFPVAKVFKYTEYMIILLGAAMLQNGLTKLVGLYSNVDLADVFPFPLLLPSTETVIGHMIKSFTGVSPQFSLAKLAIMLAYFVVIYLLFYRQTPSVHGKQDE
jgi:high-affinity iron transporter